MSNKELNIVNALLMDSYTDEGWLSDIPNFAKDVQDTQILVKQGGFIDVWQIAEIANRIAEQRIIKLLEANCSCEDEVYCGVRVSIDLINGENK